MPCSDNNDALEKYMNILDEIRALCTKSATQHLIIAGDWNADPIRNDRRTTFFNNFIAQEELINVLDMDIANVSYTYWNQRVTPPTTSTVDHFLLSPNLTNTVTQYETVFQHNDFSDHFPVMLTLNINVNYQKTYKKEFKPSVAWHKCNDINIESYKKHMDKTLLKLNSMQEALTCKNYDCATHNENIFVLYKEIIEICNNASKACLPHTTGNKGSMIVPGWNEYVKEHAENA